MPVAALGQSSIHSDFVPDAVDRVEKIKQGNPLDTETTTGAQASNDQLEKILSCLDIGRQEGHLTVDVVMGRGSGLLVEAPGGVRFHLHACVCRQAGGAATSRRCPDRSRASATKPLALSSSTRSRRKATVSGNRARVVPTACRICMKAPSTTRRPP